MASRRQDRLVARVSAVTLAVCGTFLGSSGARAQQAVASDGSIEQVVVTAQRREQNIQDVPTAVSAFSAAAIERLGISSLEELAEHVTGVYVYDDRNSGQPTWVIRGVGTQDFNSNNSPTASVYYDDLYLGSNILGGIGMFDIEQVEVLKGPQGGLYGRNTTGGAIRLNSVKPSLTESSGYVKANYGRWDRSGFQAAIGRPLNDVAGFRLAVMADRGGGWQDSLATQKDDNWGDKKVTAMRGSFIVKPSKDFEAILKLEGGEDKSETQLATAIAPWSSVGPGTCAALPSGKREPGCWTQANINNFLTPFFPPFPPAVPIGPLASQQKEDGTVVLSNPINRVDNDWFGSNLQMKWNLGSADLVSITGYVKHDGKQVFDSDASPNTILHEDAGVVEYKAWSQELRLVSTANGPFTWVAGASYAKETIKDRREFPIDDLWGDFGFGFGPQGFPGLRSAREWQQDSRAWSLYGDAGYQLTKAVKLRASLRYTDEKKELDDLTVEFPSRQGYIIDNRGAAPLEYNLDKHWGGELGVDWKYSENSLVYAKVTRAQKSGGFFGGFSFTPDAYNFYKEESNTAYELGFKSDSLDKTLRVNGNVFLYDYKDLQGYTLVNNLVKLDNLGDARNIGVELEVSWAPQSVKGLTLGAGLIYLDGKLTSHDPLVAYSNNPATGSPLFDPHGLDIPASKWAYQLQARYQRPVADNIIGSVQLDYSWRDAILSRGAFASFDDFGYQVFGTEDYGILNGRIGLDAREGWNVALSVKNLTNTEYFSDPGTDNWGSYREFAGQPRTWMLEVGYKF